MTSIKAQIASLPFHLKSRLAANWVLYVNTGSLVATTAITSGLGFVYWWLAAQLFPQQAVGFASAAVSAMMLLGAVAMLGLGTLIITEIGREPHNAGSIAITAILLVGITSVVLSVLFALAAPTLTEELAPLSASVGNIMLFACGVALTAITYTVDQVMIALLRGGLQLSRNILFAIAKLVVLYVVAVWVSENSGMNIYAAWMIGNAVSLAVIIGFLVLNRIKVLYPPRLGFIRRLGRAALAHHATNLILQAPSLMMPIAVTTLLSATANASFYAAWMVASFLFVVPAHLTTVLHAVGAQSPKAVVSKMHSTIRLAFLLGIPASMILFLGADLLLSVFGRQYVDQASWCLRILSLGIFPLTIKHHYVALLRIYSQVQSAILFLLLTSVLEIAFAVIGMKLGTLTGLAVGWLLAVCIEAGIMYIKLRRMTDTMASSQSQPA